MENEKERRLGLLGTVLRRTGFCVGTAAYAGRKLSGTVKNLLTNDVDDYVPATDKDEQAEAASQGPAPGLQTESIAPAGDEPADKITAMESDLAEVRSRFDEAQNQFEEMQSQFTSQLTELQSRNDSLLFDLEQANKEIGHLKSTEATLRARVTALETELDAAKAELEEVRRPKSITKPQLLSKADVARTKPEALLSEPRQYETVVAVEQKTEPPKEVTAVQRIKEKATEEPRPLPQVAEYIIPVSQDVDTIETEQVDLLEKQDKEPMAVQTEQGVEIPIETSYVQPDIQERTEAETEQPQPVIAETSSSVPSDVTLEEVDAADFNNATDKVIFIKALSDMASEDETTRTDAIKLMAGVPHKFSVRAITTQMAKEPTAQIQAECIKALAELNMKEALPVIEQALNEQAVLVRLAAVRGLYRLGGPASAPQLLQMLNDENEDVRRRTASCIGWLGRKELAAELVPLLDDNCVSVRLAVIKAMVNLRNHQVVSDLIVHLEDPEKAVRKAIIAALETITGRRMSGSFPKDKKSLQILTVRWAELWKDEHKVLC
jgi:hypothetical protein